VRRLPDGGPALCYRAGPPAQVAVLKFPKLSDEKREGKQNGSRGEPLIQEYPCEVPGNAGAEA
jgi:hypothetical protein